jgi:hypothetical protein
MKFPTIVLALASAASAQFPFGGSGFGGAPGGWGFAPSCAVCISALAHCESFELTRYSAIMFLFRLFHMECVVRTLYEHGGRS